MSFSTDIELVSRLCCEQASESDWRRFYESYQQVIRSWCYGAGVPISDLDDVFHDILVKLVTGLTSYHKKDGYRFRSWLKTVVLNSLTDRLRVSNNNPFPNLVSNPDLINNKTPGPDLQAISDLADGLAEKTSSAATILARVRERVQESTWNAFVQRELMQMEVDLIAAELGIKKASVYQSCSRVRSIIKEESQSFFDDST